MHPAMSPEAAPTCEGIWALRMQDGTAALFRIFERPVSKKLVVVFDGKDEIGVDQVPGVSMWYGPMPEVITAGAQIAKKV